MQSMSICVLRLNRCSPATGVTADEPQRKGATNEKVEVRDCYQNAACIFCRADSPDDFPDNRNDGAA